MSIASDAPGSYLRRVFPIQDDCLRRSRLPLRALEAVRVLASLFGPGRRIAIPMVFYSRVQEFSFRVDAPLIHRQANTIRWSRLCHSGHTHHKTGPEALEAVATEVGQDVAGGQSAAPPKSARFRLRGSLGATQPFLEVDASKSRLA